MGSINKLSTIKSVFIVPINEHMTKIKIDFFIMPKPTQQNRSAKFVIQDINSNKIYVKYFQKTDEMSIKNIQDSLNKIEQKLYLKNVYNILFYDSKKQISFKDEIFYEKIFDVDTNIDDFIEIKFKIDLEYRRINDRNYVKNIYEILNENNNSLYIKSASNNEYSYFSNRVIIDEEIFYTFIKNIKKIKFIIKFQKISSSSIIYLYYIKNDNYRLTIKNYRL